MLYSSVNSPKPVCHPSDSLAFVMRASRHEVGGSWSIYNQWQWKRFTCCRQHRAMLIGRWYVLDCQDRSGQSGARWTNRGGWHGRKRRLNWKGRGTWGGRRRVELSCHSVVGRRLFGSSVWRESAVGRAADCWTGSQACFNYQQLASLWRACLLTRWSVTTAVAMPLKLFSGSLCQMIPALHWQR